MNNIKAWLPVICLALTGFTFVTTELMPIGLLPDIAQDMGKTEAFTGLLVTIYAWSVALTSLPLTMAVRRLNRKTLLLFLLGGFAVSQWLAAIATDFAFLMAARLMTSFCHALFWSVTPPLAVKVAPGHGTTKALAIMGSITSLASILGMPLGTIIGHNLGWRVTFALIGTLSLIVALILAKNLPSVPGAEGKKTAGEAMPWHTPIIAKTYLLTVLTVSGHFAAFTYMNPLLANSGGFSSSTIAVLLLTLGSAGIMGNIIVSRHLDVRPQTALTSALCLLAASLLIAGFAASSLPGAVLLCLVWGSSMSASTLTYQTIVIKKSTNQDVANSLYSAIFNVGIGGGALVGNTVFNAFGIGAVNYGGAVFIVLAISAALALLRRGEM